jgi:hypothetical protein
MRALQMDWEKIYSKAEFGGSYKILEKQNFVTGGLKIFKNILTHKPRFPGRKILFAPLLSEK